ncbi:MAG: hypothetical protein ACI809_001432 [Candidatus Azotimanducaceae bacterium]|jgi:hypothetical protein
MATWSKISKWRWINGLVSWRRALANSGDLQIGGQQGRFCYFDTEVHGGTAIEISDISGTKGKFLEKTRQVAASRDGSRPIRVVE